MPIYVLRNESGRQGKEPEEKQLLSAEAVTLLRKQVLLKVKQAASVGALRGNRYIASILYFWRDEANDDELAAFIRAELGSPEGLSALLRGFMTHIRTSTGNGVRSTADIKPSNLVAFLPVSEWESALNRWEGEMRADDQEAITAFRNGIRKRAEGVSEDSMGWTRDM